MPLSHVKIYGKLRGAMGEPMDLSELKLTRQDRDEIAAAAELYGESITEFVTQSVLWVVYNCAEVADGKITCMDKRPKSMI